MAIFDDTGLTISTFQEIREDLLQRQRASSALGPTLVGTPDSPIGQLNGVNAEKLRELEELLLKIWQSFDPNSASGTHLSNLGAIVGVRRQEATKATLTATVNLDDGVTLAVGRQASVAGQPGQLFETIESVSNGSGSAANLTVRMEAVESGASYFAAAGTLTNIVTPVSGWNSITNGADSTQGTDIETDSAFRLRRQQSLSVSGSATAEAIVAAVRNVPGVDSASVLVNRSNSVNADGLPPKSFEVVAAGGADNDIAAAILDEWPAGIEAFGSASGTAQSSEFGPVVLNFSRPTLVSVYADFELTTNSDYPGDAAFKSAVAQAANTYFGLGQTVARAKLFDLAFGVAGVLDVTTLEIGRSPSPSGTINLAMAAREQASFSTLNITVL